MKSMFYGAFGDIIYDLKAQAQAYVGQMLIDRQVLNTIQSNSPNTSTQNSAADLLVTQGQLETQLTTVNAQIAAGDLSITDYASILIFFTSVSNHLNNVDNLNKVYTQETGQSAGATSVIGMDITTMLLVAAAIGVSGYLIYKYVKGRNV